MNQNQNQNDGKLLIGRPYGGTALFIKKSIKCTITNCDMECDRFNAMLVDLYNFTVLITCFYMPCDSNNCDGFSSTIVAFQALKSKACSKLCYFARGILM